MRDARKNRVVDHSRERCVIGGLCRGGGVGVTPSRFMAYVSKSALVSSPSHLQTSLARKALSLHRDNTEEKCDDSSRFSQSRGLTPPAQRAACSSSLIQNLEEALTGNAACFRAIELQL
ncbi:hypothetical protein SKAU_G00090270 [Synaphobranchus kaupii]|uniref:Uncharacterized protein n=1 Tax=Synaphobranchus kaupii TaxID=118154 RepID=A0A9Q1FX39_SYNKA|nr:hypothetical protein SKAU_G00090270 [Synaphobranchus kaupii]